MRSPSLSIAMESTWSTPELPNPILKFHSLDSFEKAMKPSLSLQLPVSQIWLESWPFSPIRIDETNAPPIATVSLANGTISLIQSSLNPPTDITQPNVAFPSSVEETISESLNSKGSGTNTVAKRSRIRTDIGRSMNI